MNIARAMKVLIVAVLFAFGCAKGEVSPVGTWANDKLPETIEFKGDQTGVFVVKDKPSLSFKWTAADKGRVKMDIDFQGTVKTLYGKVDNGTFVMESDGQKATYRKVK